MRAEKEWKAFLGKQVKRERGDCRMHSWGILANPDRLDPGATLVTKVLLAHPDLQGHLGPYSLLTGQEHQETQGRRGWMEPQVILAHWAYLEEWATLGSRVRGETREKQDILDHMDSGARWGSLVFPESMAFLATKETRVTRG